jgi:hypothetical protein
VDLDHPPGAAGEGHVVGDLDERPDLTENFWRGWIWPT